MTARKKVEGAELLLVIADQLEEQGNSEVAKIAARAAHDAYESALRHERFSEILTTEEIERIAPDMNRAKKRADLSLLKGPAIDLIENQPIRIRLRENMIVLAQIDEHTIERVQDFGFGVDRGYYGMPTGRPLVRLQLRLSGEIER